MADFAPWLCSNQQSIAIMASSRNSLLDDEIVQRLLEELTGSDQISSCDDDASSGTNDLTVGEVIISEYSDEGRDDYNVLLHRVRLVLRLRGRTLQII
jgi:hypothetical protein